MVGRAGGPFSQVLGHRICLSALDHIESSKVELDSHADSPVVGDNAHILEYTGKKVSVVGFTDALGKSLLVDVVHAAVVYDCATTGQSFLIIIHNALHVKSMDVCLFNPFIMRLA